MAQTVTCQRMVTVGWRRSDNSEIKVHCGSWHGGEVILCDVHETMARARYPQGWRGSPGDVCRHGVYVGGCGADHMCGYCEMGED